jgi:hypothetical protein
MGNVQKHHIANMHPCTYEHGICRSQQEVGLCAELFIFYLFAFAGSVISIAIRCCNRFFDTRQALSPLTLLSVGPPCATVANWYQWQRMASPAAASGSDGATAWITAFCLGWPRIARPMRTTVASSSGSVDWRQACPPVAMRQYVCIMAPHATYADASGNQ